MPNLDEEQGTHRTLVKANVGKASSGYATTVFEHQICYLKCEPLGGE